MKVLSLNQRDRNAVFFSQEEGARLLVCSEIGSEGRNFQFCHNLILFDLPLNPGLLEQRIGRLTALVKLLTYKFSIHIEKGGPESVLARFYNEGLNAFSHPLHGGEQMTQSLKVSLEEVIIQEAEALNGADNALEELVAMAVKVRKRFSSSSKKAEITYLNSILLILKGDWRFVKNFATVMIAVNCQITWISFLISSVLIAEM